MRPDITLCLACALTACSAGVQVRSTSMTEVIPTGGFAVTRDRVPPDPMPHMFEFDVGFDQGEPTCKECLVLMNSVYEFCHEQSENSQYCSCVRGAFTKACAQYEQQMRRKCKEAKPIPMSWIGSP